MSRAQNLRCPLVLALLAALSASPAPAQEKGRYPELGRRHESYRERHGAFHREHGRECAARVAARPRDARWRARVTAKCRAEHERWHDRAGVNHDGSRRR